ncbi:MAG: hypothetical protein QME52_08940 [Bacteroidota bacterium]|nr:hypothetical protein [Bacteroidota bacterium]
MNKIYPEMGFEEILTLLIGTADEKVKPSQLIEACRKYDMHQIEYININGDLLFKEGYNFLYNSPNGETARLEIIEKDGVLLQSGIQIIYRPRLLFSKINKDFSVLFNLLKSYYGNEQIQTYQGIIIYNFTNQITQCYLTQSTINKQQVLNCRVSNIEIWKMYN